GSVEQLAAQPSAGERDDHGFELHLRHLFGEIDGVANGLFRGGEIDDGAAFHPARGDMTEAEDLDAMAATPQHLLWRLRLEARDQAGDLAGADVERGDHGLAARRDGLHLRGHAEGNDGHASPPLRFTFFSFSLIAASRACAASSESRTVTRSRSRRSTAVISRESRC